MSDVFGTDFSLSSGDRVVSAVGDYVMVSGTDNLQQALERRWGTRKRALFYAPDYGNGVYDLLSQPITSNWIDQATRAASQCILDDPRVSDVQVTVTPNPQKRTVVFQFQWTAVDGSTGVLTQEVITGVQVV